MTRHAVLLLFFFLCSSSLVAQAPDSVTVTGRIRNLTARLYRQNSAVSISRNNILQASREMARPAPLQPDGSFRVTLPLVYPYEEFYFNYGTISTAFLASAGTIEISLDADSLFQTEIPFRFSGTNGQVNNALSRYKAFEYKNRKSAPDGQQLTRQVAGRSAEASWRTLVDEFSKIYRSYSQTNPVLPLLDAYLRSVSRYEAAAFLYDKTAAEGTDLPASLTDSLRPPNDRFLSAQRTTAMERFAGYAGSKIDNPANPLAGNNRSVPIRTFATLIDRYVSEMSESERSRIQELKTSRSGTNRDLALLQRLFQRHSDTLSKLLAYEITVAQYQRHVDSVGLDFLKAQFVAGNLPTMALRDQQLLHTHVAPQVADRRYRMSLDELYRLEVKDSALVRQVSERIKKAGSLSAPTEILSGVYLLRDSEVGGRRLLDLLKEQGRGRLIYVLSWSSNSESTRQEVLSAYQLQQTLSSRDILFVYLCGFDSDPLVWQEWVARNRPSGLHVYMTNDQTGELAGPLRLSEAPSATLMGRDGKYIKRNAPLPSNQADLLKLIQSNL